ncbi:MULTISPECIES: SanA/YdcF family protein [Spirosoma]|uniref:SanA protein n=1 Tax=Spirosoma sordidisoli TaxID=2502893 RepID=A0A4Q2UK03_9BACT|nr:MULTISPECIES: ElyC/SanA/YdcF family protein [Spirosoma]RYC69584.1 SanA protein [Spirosoma sordidisoli]
MDSTLASDYTNQSPREAVGVRVVKGVIKFSIAVAFVGATVVLICNWWVVQNTRNQIYFNLQELPANDVGLVLGTSKFVRTGKENLFFRYRMEATARLWKEGKVKYLILSGNNDSEYYNEPADMQRALIRLGVPGSVMTLDYAGYRTFDSVVRCKDVFNQEKITIISQNFHNARALFIGNHEGIEAIAFAAQDVPDGYSLKTLVREYLARPYAILDVFVLRPQPEKGNWPRR